MDAEPVARDALHERCLATRRRSAQLCARAAAAAELAVSRSADARRLVQLADQACGRPCFWVRGVVDGRDAVVTWRGGRLRGEAAVLDRVGLVVALAGIGRRDERPAPSLCGSRGQALLAVVRAFDRICAVRISA